MTIALSPSSSVGTTSPRLMSIDVLRGFDMFWILGADTVVHALHHLFNNPVTALIDGQMDHCEWAGFHFYDMIFPLFIYIAGISIVLSMTKAIEKDGRTKTLQRVARRSALLILLGIICYGGVGKDWDSVRLLGVLQRIGIAYFITSILFCFLKPRGLLIACVSLLIGYWGLMTFVPIRDIHLEKSELARVAKEQGIKSDRQNFLNTTTMVTGRYEPGYNLSDHVDYQYLPGRKWNQYYDPEGLLSTIPAIATCLLGVFTGLLLRNRVWSDHRKLTILIGAGISGVVLGHVWGLQFPVIKSIWTSSFVLVAGGWSAILLGLFYWIIDMKGWKSWSTPFMWIGMNAITAYMFINLVDVRVLANYIVGGPVAKALDVHIAAGLGNVVGSIAALGIVIIFVRFLHQRQIFLRL